MAQSAVASEEGREGQALGTLASAAWMPLLGRNLREVASQRVV